MIPYLVCFSVVYFLSVISEKAYEHKKRIAFFCGIISVLILSFFAGIRGYQVGTDIRFYILPQFYRAQTYITSFHNFWNANVEDAELLFLVLEFISVRLFQSPHFVMFALSFLTNGFVYMGIVKQRGKMSIPFAWLCYCLIYFNISLNLMRQSVSIAIIFYLFSDLDRLNLKRVVFFSIFASLFHISGLIGFFFYTVYLLICRRSKINGLKHIFFFLFLLLPVVVPFAISTIIRVGALNQRYYIYNESQGNVAIGNLIFRILCIINFVLLCYRSSREERKSQHYFLLYAGIINILFIINNSLIFIRLREYFEIFSMVYIPMGLRVHSHKNDQRAFVAILLVVMMIVYWYYQFVYLNHGQTYPYSIDPLWMKPLS